jgi:hypothetical protein
VTRATISAAERAAHAQGLREVMMLTAMALRDTLEGVVIGGTEYEVHD